MIEHLNSIFPLELIKHAKRISNISFDILTTGFYKQDAIEGVCEKVHVVEAGFQPWVNIPIISRALWGVSLTLRRAWTLNTIESYDVCHIHSLDATYGPLIGILSKKAKHIVISVYGSELYDSLWKYFRILQRQLIDRAEVITFTNPRTSIDFLKVFGDRYRTKIRVIGLGTTPLEKINELIDEPRTDSRVKLGLPQNSIVVTCGYCGQSLHQHLKMLASIRNVSPSLPDNLFLVFPMTYGATPEYRNLVMRALADSGFRYKIFDMFMSDDDVARLRRATDIMINVPETDQFSGSMQEHVYAGNVVINGSWLPYDLLYDNGVFALKATTVDEVGLLLVNAIENYQVLAARSQKGKDAIWALTSWEANTPKWIELYRELASA